MFGDKEKESVNFDSIPNISFDSNGQPISNINNIENGDFNDFPGFNADVMQVEEPMSTQLEKNSNTTVGNVSIEHNSMSVNSSGFNMFTCGDCHLTFGVNGGYATDCIFCHGNNITPSQPVDTIFEGIIPFTIQRNIAVEDYKSKIMLNPVIPFVFKSKKTIDLISKIYIPGYLYNALTNGEVNLLCADNTQNGKKKFDVAFNTSVEYENVFYKSNSKIAEKVFNAIGDYNFNNIVPYDNNNLGNCYFLASDLSKMDIINKVEDNCKKHVISIARRKVNHQMKKVQGNNLITQINKSSSILIPVYLLNVRYGNKDYMYIMNGENGKSSLEVTYGIIEMLIFGLIVALLVFGVSVLISIMF